MPTYFKPKYPLTADAESGEFATATDPYAVGAIDDGEGDLGGKSYGTYQFPSSAKYRDHLVAFVNWVGNPFSKQLKDAGSIASQQFDVVWKQLAKTDNLEFGLAQETYCREFMWSELLKRFEDTSGVVLQNREDKLVDLVVGTVNQYGTISNSIAKYIATNGGDTLTTNQIGVLMQNYKLANNDTIFRSSSQSTRNGVEARILRERRLFE